MAHGLLLYAKTHDMVSKCMFVNINKFETIIFVIIKHSLKCQNNITCVGEDFLSADGGMMIDKQDCNMRANVFFSFIKTFFCLLKVTLKVKTFYTIPSLCRPIHFPFQPPFNF